MQYITDLALGFAALSAAAYCMVLSRRLRALSRLDGTMGSAIAVFSAQVDELSRALQAARHSSEGARTQLESQTSRAEAAARRLELMLTALQQPDGAPDRIDPRGTDPRGFSAVEAYPAQPLTSASAVAPDLFWAKHADHAASTDDTGQRDLGQPDPARPRVVRRRRLLGNAG